MRLHPDVAISRRVHRAPSFFTVPRTAALTAAVCLSPYCNISCVMHARPVNADNGHFSKLNYASEPFQVCKYKQKLQYLGTSCMLVLFLFSIPFIIFVVLFLSPS